jgi:hypothetical protein
MGNVKSVYIRLVKPSDMRQLGRNMGILGGRIVLKEMLSRVECMDRSHVASHTEQ